MSSWTDHTGHDRLRSFTAEGGKLCVEQNKSKRSRWAKFARERHDFAWEFDEGGGYSGRIMIDWDMYTPAEATKKFLGGSSCAPVHVYQLSVH